VSRRPGYLLRLPFRERDEPTGVAQQQLLDRIVGEHLRKQNALQGDRNPEDSSHNPIEGRERAAEPGKSKGKARSPHPRWRV